MPHSHFAYVNALRHQGTPAQQACFFGEVLAGKRFGNAQSEVGTKHVRDYRTTLDADRPGRAGASTASRATPPARCSPTGSRCSPTSTSTARCTSPGSSATRPASTVVDDWDGIGQRTTASGSVRLEGVAVDDARITPYHLTFTGPQTYGAFAQVLHAAIDAGIARAAIAEAAPVRDHRSRGPTPTPASSATPTTRWSCRRSARWRSRCAAPRRSSAEAARAVDRAERRPRPRESAAAASLAVAAARAATTAASVDVSSRLFEVAGTRSALRSLDLDRHWRNARTHTLHDPAAWKVQHLGRYVLDGTAPPNHGQL